MKTITMYELLGLVKDGKAPKIIKYNGYLLSWDSVNKDYYCKEYGDYLFTYLFTNEQTTLVLEEKVEILEEKKIPEKLKEFDIQGLEVSGYSMTQAEYLLEDGVKENREMINWILDYLKSKGDE